MSRDADQNNLSAEKAAELVKAEELEEEEEIKRISRLNPPTSCGRDEDRFGNK